MAVANAFLDCVQEVAFLSFASLVTSEFELADELWVAWHFNWTNNFISLLDNYVGSVAAEPVNEITELEVLFSGVVVASDGDFVVWGSASGHTDASANAGWVFFEFTDDATVLLQVVNVVSGEDTTWWWADAVSALDILFNSVFVILAHSSNFIS